MFKSARDWWAALAQFTAWLAGLVLQFVSTPARLRLEADSSISTARFVQFVLTVIAGLILVAFWRHCRRRNVRGWVIASAASLALGIAAFGAYQHLTNSWTCAYSRVPAVVIGATFKPAAARFAASIPDPSCTIMLRDFGENWEIWVEAEIGNRYLMLVGLFSLIVVALSLSVMFLLQAWRCAGRPADPD